MNEELHVNMSESFKDDLQKFAEQRGVGMGEYMREAARREMQRDLIENNE